MKNAEIKSLSLLSLNQQKGLDLEGLQMKLGLIIFLKVIQKVLFFLWIKKENIKLLKKKMLFFLRKIGVFVLEIIQFLFIIILQVEMITSPKIQKHMISLKK